MEDKEKEALELLADCDETISTGMTDNFASYDEGVRDTLLWLFEGGCKPTVGREL